MLPKDFDPHNCHDASLLKIYFQDFLGLTPEEAAPLIANWARETPQTDEEVISGVFWERQNREDAANDWVGNII